MMRKPRFIIGFMVALTLALALPACAANTLSYPKFRAWNRSDGNPLVGGKLYSYKVGTSTKTNTYVDAALTVANINPAILDSNGEALVYLKDSVKLALYDANNSLQWTVTEAQQPTLWTFNAPKAGVYYSSVVYGGTLVALQNALTAVGSSEATLYLAPATWLITGDLTIPANVTLKPERGAVLTIATTKTFTLNGPLEAGSYQIFSCAGSGKVLFGANAAQNVRPEWFGAPQGNTGDGAAAFALMTTAINNAGSGSVLLSPTTYRFTAPIGSSVCSFSGLNGIEIKGYAVFNDIQAYSGMSDLATLFNFTHCKNIKIGPIKTTSQVMSYATLYGFSAIVFKQGCQGIDVDLEVVGGMDGVKWNKLYTDPDSYRSRQARVRVRATNCHYPILSQFGLNGAEIDLYANNCGRNFYFYGTDDVKIRVISVNQQVTSIISAYSGYGCKDISVDYNDRDSNNCQPAAPVMSLIWGDSTPAEHRNIKIHFGLYNNPTLPFSHSLTFAKYSDGGTTPDVTGRGHTLNGFELSGYSYQQTGHAHVLIAYGAYGVLTSPDKVYNYTWKDFRMEGAGATAAYTAGLEVLQDTANFINVKGDIVTNIFATNPTGKAVFVGCRAAGFTIDTSDTSIHSYYDCVMTSHINQSKINKTFYNSTINGVYQPSW